MNIQLLTEKFEEQLTVQYKVRDSLSIARLAGNPFFNTQSFHKLNLLCKIQLERAEFILISFELQDEQSAEAYIMEYCKQHEEQSAHLNYAVSLVPELEKELSVVAFPSFAHQAEIELVSADKINIQLTELPELEPGIINEADAFFTIGEIDPATLTFPRDLDVSNEIVKSILKNSLPVKNTNVVPHSSTASSPSFFRTPEESNPRSLVDRVKTRSRARPYPETNKKDVDRIIATDIFKTSKSTKIKTVDAAKGRKTFNEEPKQEFAAKIQLLEEANTRRQNTLES